MEKTNEMDDCLTCFYDTCCNCFLNPQYRHLTEKEKVQRWTTNLTFGDSIELAHIGGSKKYGYNLDKNMRWHPRNEASRYKEQKQAVINGPNGPSQLQDEEVPLSPPMGNDGTPIFDYIKPERKKGHVFFNNVVQQVRIENCLAIADAKLVDAEDNLLENLAKQMAELDLETYDSSNSGSSDSRDTGPSLSSLDDDMDENSL